MDQDMQVLMARVAKLGEMSDSEARRIVNQVYQDGIVSRGEAEALFRLNDALSKTDPVWSERFTEAVTDYLITREPPVGWVTEEEAEWLLAQVEHQGDAPSLSEIDLVLHVLRRADGAHESLADQALRAVAARIRAEGRVTSDMVERMRIAVSARAGDGASWVTRTEAVILFETNDAVAFAKNHPSWNDFFARAIANHLMAAAHPDPVSEQEALRREKWVSNTAVNPLRLMMSMASSFDGNWFEKVAYSREKAAKARSAAADAALRQAEKVTDDENRWFLERLGWDEKISPAEKALIAFLKAEAPGFANGLTIAA